MDQKPGVQGSMEQKLQKSHKEMEKIMFNIAQRDREKAIYIRELTKVEKILSTI